MLTCLYEFRINGFKPLTCVCTIFLFVCLFVCLAYLVIAEGKTRFETGSFVATGGGRRTCVAFFYNDEK